MKKSYLLPAACLSLFVVSVSCGHSDTDTHGASTSVEESNDHRNQDHGGLIELNEHRAKRFGVATEKIMPSDFTDVIMVSGRIESKASDEGVATATRNGILTLSPNINTGVKVSVGSAIGSVSAAKVQGGNPSVQARASRDAARREVDRLAPLFKEGVVSADVYNAALRSYEEAEATLHTLSQGSGNVMSPKTGVITALLAKSGEYVEVGQKVAVISGNTSLTLRADVPERYIRELSVIETANFRPAYSSDVFSISELDGRMISNPGTAVSENGYIPVYFSFGNNGSVAPGAFAEVWLKSGLRHGVLSVPMEAVVEISGNKCIYCKHSEGHYVKHPVTLGASNGKRVEILSGLSEGEEVVVKGAQIVRMAETSSAAVPGHTHNH